MSTKRLRIFAGPNGSGKSVLYKYLLIMRFSVKPNGSGKSVLYKYLISQQFFNRYYYINADDIANGLINGFSFANWPIDINATDFFSYVKSSTFMEKNLIIEDSVFLWKGENKSLTYISACIADYVRNLFLLSESSFACETVFSHPSKIDFIKNAKKKGFKVYLYFIATRNPVINQARVENRVLSGGHDVPVDKIVSRYYKCLDNLYEAMCFCDKVFLFDNSESKNDFSYNNFAEVNNGNCRIISDFVPEWFVQYVYKKIPNNID